MSKVEKVDICIIGAGSAGLSIAAGAAQLGAKTVLIEAQKMGGDCLNTGCVPSKSLLAAAKTAETIRKAAHFGIECGEPRANFTHVHDYVQSVIAEIAPHDSVERFTGLGCQVIKAHGRFIDARTVEAGGQLIQARRFVIATGSRAAVPPIPGLDAVSFFTNESIFENTLLPEHLIVVGAGPIGCELAQAHRRLGSNVTILDLGLMMPKDDPEAVEVVRQRFVAEGIVTEEMIKVLRVENRNSGLSVIISDGDRERSIDGSHLLVAVGRRPNIENLGLEAAGVRYSTKGIEVDGRLRSSNRRIYAAGDVAGGYQFTHIAAYHAGIVIRNALFRLPAKASTKAVPWVTYTDPELAHVGMNEADARKAHGESVNVVRAEFASNDRAQTESANQGFLKCMLKGNKIIGATIVGAHAGELILPWVLAVSNGLKIGDLANIIVPYPTLSEISKRAAGSYYTPTLFSKRTRALVKFLGLFG